MITILGAAGFIGSHLTAYLQREGIAHRTPARGESLAGHDLGHVIDCAGFTGDFRTRREEVIEAHVTRVEAILQHCTFESFLYLSSARVYRHHRSEVAREDDRIAVDPNDPDDLYTLSKLMGESIVLQSPNGRVARLSNVHGAGVRSTFLAHILDDARTRGTIELETALDSEKDYINIDDVAPLLVNIALHGTQKLYNVASGVNLTHREIVRTIGARVSVRENAPSIRFPRIDITRIREEFAFTPTPLRIEETA